MRISDWSSDVCSSDLLTINRSYGGYDDYFDAVIIIDSPASFINRSRALVPIHKESKGDRIRKCNEGWLGCQNLPLDRSLYLSHNVRVKSRSLFIQILDKLLYDIFINIIDYDGSGGDSLTGG